MLHFTTGRWADRGLKVTARARRAGTLRPRVLVTVRRAGRPVAAVVHVAGFRAETNARGRALVKPVLGAPGSFAALAHKGRLRGRSKLVRLGGATAGGAARATPAG
jgi:hypothetical protein